jgi:hypothetical protein
VIKSHLQSHLQLEKISVATPLATTEKNLCCNNACNCWKKILVATPLATAEKISVATTLATIGKKS